MHITGGVHGQGCRPVGLAPRGGVEQANLLAGGHPSGYLGDDLEVGSSQKLSQRGARRISWIRGFRVLVCGVVGLIHWGSLLAHDNNGRFTVRRHHCVANVHH